MTEKVKLETQFICFAKQLSESSLLRNIYGNSIDMRVKGINKECMPIEMTIPLIPCVDYKQEMFVKTELYVKCKEDYPLTPPLIELKNTKGIEEKLVKQLEIKLRESADENLGKEMILGLCFDIQAFLDEHNKLPLPKELENQKQNKVPQMDTLPEIDDITMAAVIPEKKKEVDAEYDPQEIANEDTRLVKDYKVLEKLGESAFGCVFKVQNKLDGNYYAVKKIILKPEAIKLMTQEVKCLSRMQHTNIVRYFTSWASRDNKKSEVVSMSKSPTDCKLYIQMELCDKSTLRDCIDKEIFMNKNLVWLLFREIVDGLDYIHQQQITHRDLKPDNIFIDTNNCIKIGDFGFATILDDIPSLESSVDYPNVRLHSAKVGNCYYMSPEMTKGEQIYDQKMDMYSLGIILFEMCYKPIKTVSDREKVFCKLRHFSPSIPDDFIDISSEKKIILWLLSHDPAKRPTAKELLDSTLLPSLSSYYTKIKEALIYAVKNTDSEEHILLMSTLFNQQSTETVDLYYDYMSTKGLNFKEMQELTLARQYVVGILKKIFLTHGAQFHEEPILMPRTQKISPETCNEVLLANKSGNIFSLRYNSRVNFARYVEKNNILNTKKFFIGKIYSEFEIPELHPEELWECSFDVISSSPHLNLEFDREVIMIMEEIFHQLPGFSDKEFLLKLNHINFITAIMKYCKIPKELHKDVILGFKEYKDEKSLFAKLSKLKCSVTTFKNLCCLTQKEFAYEDISKLMREIFKKLQVDEKELHQFNQNLEYFDNLMGLIKAHNSKFKVVFSLRLCGNIHNNSGMCFQIWQKSNTRLEVLAFGACYDNLFNNGEGLDERHGIGVSMSLDKIISSVRACQTLSEGKSFIPPIVELLVSSTQPMVYDKKMNQLIHMLWNLGISCKLFDGHDNTLQSLKDYCKTNRIPFLVIVDCENKLIKIDSCGKDCVMYIEEDDSKFANFFSEGMCQELVDLKNIDLDDISNLKENDNRFMCEVKLVGSTMEYKESSKILANLKDVLDNFTSPIIIFPLEETTDDLLKSLFANLEVKNEDSFRKSMNAVCQECPDHEEYIQKLTDDVLSKKFRRDTDRHVVMILYNIKDDSYRVFM